MSTPTPSLPSKAALAVGFVPDRPDLGHAAEGLDLSTASFFATANAPATPHLLHPVAYRSLAFANLEDDAVWTRSWLCIGLQDEIPRAGDLLPFTAGHHGIHVQRSEDGGLVGRFNKAQHGGCRTVPLQCQTGTKTRCSFTACGYSRDGFPLSAAPEGQPTPAMHQYLGLRPERLLPVTVATAGPLIFARLVPTDGPSCVEALPSPSLAVTPGTTVRRAEYDANWKLVLAALAEGSGALEGESRFTLASRRTDGAVLRIDVLFPNLVLLSAGDATCAIILQPTALDRTLCRVVLFGGPADEAVWSAEIDARTQAAVVLQAALSRAESLAEPEAQVATHKANLAARWLQAELATRILSRPDIGQTHPLYATAQGRRR